MASPIEHLPQFEGPDWENLAPEVVVDGNDVVLEGFEDPFAEDVIAPSLSGDVAERMTP